VLGGVKGDDYDDGGADLDPDRRRGITIVWSGVVSLILLKLIDMTMGLRVSTDQEREGLDTISHGESAYHY
jgi:Amt family ammonium transporter